MKPGLFTLGLYQLENLIAARPGFRFLDVRVHPQSIASPRIQAVLNQAAVVRATDLRTYLTSLSVRKDEPVILLCEDSRLSSTLGADLEAAGYQQVYIVEGGLDGLLREVVTSG